MHRASRSWMQLWQWRCGKTGKTRNIQWGRSLLYVLSYSQFLAHPVDSFGHGLFKLRGQRRIRNFAKAQIFNSLLHVWVMGQLNSADLDKKMVEFSVWFFLELLLMEVSGNVLTQISLFMHMFAPFCYVLCF